jgi:hypothetical protein
MRLPDKNVRPIGFLKLLHSSPPKGGDFLQHFRKGEDKRQTPLEMEGL